MTDGEKKMKRYVNAVERRLNLPKDVKARVMSDFGSSITARREAGQTDEQIYEELGEPKQAAAELNEQMKEFAYRKSPWRFVFLGAVVVSGGWFVYYGLLRILTYLLFSIEVSDAASIGIIGGADGPTAIFITSSPRIDWDHVFFVILLIVGVFGYLRLRKCKKK